MWENHNEYVSEEVGHGHVTYVCNFVGTFCQRNWKTPSHIMKVLGNTIDMLHNQYGNQIHDTGAMKTVIAIFVLIWEECAYTKHKFRTL